MTWLKNLLIKSKNDLSGAKLILPVQNNEIPKSNWYFKRSRDKKISQFVLSVPVSCIRETEFQMIILPYDEFPILASQPWCSGFVRMQNKPVPYQMIRVDQFDEEIKKSDLTIAFSFCRLPSGGIFLMDTRIENQMLVKSVRKKFPFVPPINKPIVEWVVSMDDRYSVQMMKDLFSSSELNIIVANSKGAITSVMDNAGNFNDCVGPFAHHNRTVTLNNEVNNILTNELNQLIDYNKSILSSQRSFQKAQQELSVLLPVNKDPIIAPESLLDPSELWKNSSKIKTYRFGRISKRVYFTRAIIIILFLWILSQSSIFSIVLPIVLLSVESIKRCHDLNKNGWYQLHPIYIFKMLFKKGDLEDNYYGVSPICEKPINWSKIHVWEGCTCSRCGIARDERHDWNGCICSKCEKTRDQQHEWLKNPEKCSKCGRPQDMSQS